MGPVKSWQGKEGCEFGPIFLEAFRRFRIFCVKRFFELFLSDDGVREFLRVHDLAEYPLSARLNSFWKIVQDVTHLVEPAALLTCFFKAACIADRRPEPQCPVTDGERWRSQPTVSKIREYCAPRIFALAIAGLAGKQVFFTVFSDSNQNKKTPVSCPLQVSHSHELHRQRDMHSGL
jgi:hypothetical protein